MNFKPGFSNAIGYLSYPEYSMHEVRDRDYFFVISFLVWGLWAGIGLASMVRPARERSPTRSRVVGAGVLLVALLPFLANFAAATRRHRPDSRLAADFAYSLLNTVPPYGILFTYADNDTFPLWWAQEVEGIRRDVTVVCLALAQTHWYMKQLRDRPPSAFDESSSPPIWQGLGLSPPQGPVHTLTDAEIDRLEPMRLPRDVTVPIGPLSKTYHAGAVFMTSDLLVLRILQHNLGKRPLVWSLTARSDFQGLDDFVVQQGLGFRLETERPDSTSRDLDASRLFGAVLDVPLTEQLLWRTYRYAGLLESHDPDELEAASASVANSMGLPFAALAGAYDARGETERALRNLERAAVIAPNPAIRAALEKMRGEAVTQ
jgi:hypothetical protein